MRRQLLLATLVLVMLISSQAVVAQTDREEKRPDSFDELFLPFIETVIDSEGSVDRELNRDSPFATGLGSGLALATLIKLFDLYEDDFFIDTASGVSSFLSTSLNDPRYPLIATYYDKDEKLTSNYRSVVDNFLIAWGLSELADRIKDNDELEFKIQQERSAFVTNQLELFDKETGFIEELRVDRETTSNIFNVFTNLMASFIVTESDSDIFSIFADKPEEVYQYVTDNAVTAGGGVNTLVFNGISDELITLRNTALYANLALNLYLQTDDTSYLNAANQSMQFIQLEFYDIGVTGGYFETLLDGSPVQQSKSLFSHALILQLLLRLANLGDNGARLNLLAVWRTISSHFRGDGSFFLSSIDRGGNAASDSVNSVDNLMMIYAMSGLPLMSKVNYTQMVEYRDKVHMDVFVQAPDNVRSKLVLYLNGEEVDNRVIEGKVGKQQINFEFNAPRPENEYERFDYEFVLSSEGVVTDRMYLDIEVTLAPGIDLSIGVISVFSVMAVVIFVMFMKRYGEIVPQVQS